MCIHFTSNPTSNWVGGFWGNGHVGPAPHEVWPHQVATMITESGNGPAAGDAVFGLVPFWTKECRKSATMNARAETVAQLASYREPWRRSQRCLVPMTRFFEPCYESGRAVETEIGRVDGEPFTAAGIWDGWTDRATGSTLWSFSLLTINAAECPLMSRMHKPKDEKRSLVVIEPAQREKWLKTSETATAMKMLHRLVPDEYDVIAL